MGSVLLIVPPHRDGAERAFSTRQAEPFRGCADRVDAKRAGPGARVTGHRRGRARRASPRFTMPTSASVTGRPRRPSDVNPDARKSRRSARLAVAGTRGQIHFSRTPGISVWQWAWTPTQVVDRDPARPDRFRVLH